VLKRYYWLCIKEDIIHFVKAWVDAKWTKHLTKNKAISCITSFPESQMYDTIMVMVELFTKLAHMVPIVGTPTALETA
jgi:hypothetical protein